jgi:hypothetical protein
VPKTNGKMRVCEVCGRWFRNYGSTRAHNAGVCSVICLTRLPDAQR